MSDRPLRPPPSPSRGGAPFGPVRAIVRAGDGRAGEGAGGAAEVGGAVRAGRSAGREGTGPDGALVAGSGAGRSGAGARAEAAAEEGASLRMAAFRPAGSIWRTGDRDWGASMTGRDGAASSAGRSGAPSMASAGGCKARPPGPRTMLVSTTTSFGPPTSRRCSTLSRRSRMSWRWRSRSYTSTIPRRGCRARPPELASVSRPPVSRLSTSAKSASNAKMIANAIRYLIAGGRFSIPGTDDSKTGLSRTTASAARHGHPAPRGPGWNDLAAG